MEYTNGRFPNFSYGKTGKDRYTTSVVIQGTVQCDGKIGREKVRANEPNSNPHCSVVNNAFEAVYE